MNYKISLALLAVLLMVRPIRAQDDFEFEGVGEPLEVHPAEVLEAEDKDSADAENVQEEPAVDATKTPAEAGSEEENDEAQDPADTTNEEEGNKAETQVGEAWYAEVQEFGRGAYDAAKTAGLDIWETFMDERPCVSKSKPRKAASHDRFKKKEA